MLDARASRCGAPGLPGRAQRRAREIVRLGGAGGEIHLVRRRAHERRDLCARMLDAGGGGPTSGVIRGGVAETPSCASDTHAWRSRPADRLAWSPRSRDRSARLSTQPHTPRAPCDVLHCSQHTAQDVDLVLIELGALQKAPDAAHQMCAALCAIAEVDFLEHLLEVTVQTLHLLGTCKRERCAAAHSLARRQRAAARTPRSARPSQDSAMDRHRSRECGSTHGSVPGPHSKTRSLGTEEHGDGAARGFLHDAQRGLAHIERRGSSDRARARSWPQ